MSATAADGPVATVLPHSASPATTWTSKSRIAAAATFVLAGVFWVIADLIGFNAGDELRFDAAHASLAGVGIAADILAIPFLLGSAAVWFLLSRVRSTRLAWSGLVLLVVGLVGQAMIEGVEMIGYTVARSGKIDLSTYSDVTNSPVGLPGTIFQLMFFVGTSLGIVLSMVALWRARTLPVVAGILLLVFQVVSMVGLPFPATVIALAGLAWMAIAIVRTPHPAVVTR
jgi:hypothetical protein